jgi:hypothetical protein
LLLIPKYQYLTFECGWNLVDNQLLVITTIAKSYAETLDKKQKTGYERI